MRSHIVGVVIVAALGVSACGQSVPTRSTRLSGPPPQRGLPPVPMAPVDSLSPVAGDRARNILGEVAQIRDRASNSLMRTTLFCYKDDGQVSRAKSIYKFQKPNRVMLNILESTNDKVSGTRLLWTGGAKAQVKTKFAGFWVTVSLDIGDERIRDDRGYSIAETSVPRTYETLLHSGARVAFKGEGQVAGRAVEFLDVESPLSLKPVTREVFGIDRVTRTPVLREMYHGERLIYRMQVEQISLNARFTSQDFSLD